MKIVVIGTGYVGLVTAAVFAEIGHQVVGLDIDEAKITSLKSGHIPIYEPGLEDLVKKNLKNKSLVFTTDYKLAVADAEIIFICVGTPPLPDGSYDSKFVYAAAESIAQNLTGYAVIVIKSTVPPTTNDKVSAILKHNTTQLFDLASVPEFLREGQAVKDALKPSRIVLGVNSAKAKNVLIKAHRKLKSPVLVTTPQSAQLIKYASNAMLATRISFINAVSILADKVGADIQDVSLGLGLDPRIGSSFLNAGLGYGGSCFPKDTWALITFAKNLGYDFHFLAAVDQVNSQQIDYFIGKMTKQLGNLKGKKLAILGLAFKPDTDDLREARSIELITKLEKLGVKVTATDPVAIAGAKTILPKTSFTPDPYQAIKGADGLVLVTEWEEYKKLDFGKVKKLLKQPNIFDGRNFFNPDKLTKMGFKYSGIGRGEK